MELKCVIICLGLYSYCLFMDGDGTRIGIALDYKKLRTAPTFRRCMAVLMKQRLESRSEMR